MAKRKTLTKAERKAAREKEMQQFLKRMGYSGSGPKESVHDIPCYRTDNYKATSNRIPGNGPKHPENRYTGDQLMGIATMAKSNAVPIRKDNKQGATDAAQMRRN
jgi:hypothetical protein